MKFRIASKILGLSIASIISLQISSANAEGCKLSGITLDCGTETSPEAITAIFANEGTSTALSNPINELDRFKRPIDLEVFRLSVERSWQKARLVDAHQRRKLKRRQISASKFEEWAQTYNKASENYHQAIVFYRTLVWHGKNGKPAPVDEDS